MLFIFRLREIVNQPSLINLEENYIALNSQDPAAILIYDEDVSRAILKSKLAAPTNFVDYFKFANNRPDIKFQYIEEHFRYTPVMLSGEAHKDSRKAVSKLYALIESKCPDWLPRFTEEFFAQLDDADENFDYISFVQKYLALAFNQIILLELDLHDVEMPPSVGEILHMFRSVDEINAYEKRLETLVRFVECALLAQKKDPKDAWMLVSIAVMGTEPLLGALFYGMAHESPNKEAWNAYSLLRESAPVSTVTRFMLDDLVINDLHLKKNQLLYFSFDLIHYKMNATGKHSKSYSFGDGPHTCPGNKIALIIVEAFMGAWDKRKPINLDLEKYQFQRDFILRPKIHG